MKLLWPASAFQPNWNGETGGAKPERGSAGLALCTRARSVPTAGRPSLTRRAIQLRGPGSGVRGWGGIGRAPDPGGSVLRGPRPHLSTRGTDAGAGKGHRPQARRVTWAGRALAPAPTRGGGDGGGAGGAASREASRGEGPELRAGGLLIIWRQELPGLLEEVVGPTPGRRVSFQASAAAAADPEVRAGC